MTVGPFTPTPPRASRARYRLRAVAVAVFAAIVVWTIAIGAGGKLDVTSPLVGAITITLPLVIGVALLLGLAAWGVLAVLERSARNARKTWTIIAIVILAVSVVSVAFLQTAAAAKVLLGITHLSVGLTLTLLLPRGARGSWQRKA